MKFIMCTLVVASLTAACGAEAVGNLADIAIVDRDSGQVLTAHYYRGEYWVAGKPGARYAIEVHNRVGERLLAVASVDGVNVLSGQSAGWNQTGYVLGPGERYQITGWRKSDSAIAAFTFTESPNSYAERTGRPANVGVIGVALFRERPAPATYDAPKAWLAPPASIAPLAEQGAPAVRAQAQDSALAKLGTGHGERESSYVDHTNFLRMQSQPNEIINIMYDSFDTLIAKGVIARPRGTSPGADPFPASRGPNYVPDPPG